jgi:putative nucleotidyltransferase with HDIG domain
MNRDKAWSLVQEYTTNPGLLRHMLAVELAMRAYATKLGQDEEKWGIVGLLHDFDYERWPDPPDHPLQGSKILAEQGYPDDVIYAIKSHADYLTDCPRVRPMEKALYACDELCGFLSACALIRPEGLVGMTPSSVKKKLKNKAFAAKVNRDDITRGAEDFGVDLDQHIQFLIDALAPHAEALGLGTQKKQVDNPTA